MKRLLVYILCFYSGYVISQDNLSALLHKHNTHEIPYIHIQNLDTLKSKIIVLDAREFNEYKVSHIKGAVWIGYNNFNLETVLKQFPDKNKDIVVYCSLGIRSENIAIRLKNAGYSNVKNLYGGIFEWKNNHYTVYNSEEKETDSIHAFSKKWSKWLTNGIKIYE